MRILVVGDILNKAKSELLHKYVKQDLDQAIPSIMSNIAVNRIIDGTQYTVNLSDSTGTEKDEYASIRKISYQQIDVCILIFAINDNDSYKNALNKWLPEIKELNKDTVIIAAGLSDLQIVSTKNIAPSYVDIAKSFSQAGATGYLECSLIKKDDINALFDTAERAYLDKVNGKKKKFYVRSMLDDVCVNIFSVTKDKTNNPFIQSLPMDIINLIFTELESQNKRTAYHFFAANKVISSDAPKQKQKKKRGGCSIL